MCRQRGHSHFSSLFISSPLTTAKGYHQARKREQRGERMFACTCLCTADTCAHISPCLTALHSRIRCRALATEIGRQRARLELIAAVYFLSILPYLGMHLFDDRFAFRCRYDVAAFFKVKLSVESGKETSSAIDGLIPLYP